MWFVKPLVLLSSVDINLSIGFNDEILLPKLGAIIPSQDYPKSIAHYDPPKGSHLTFLSHTNSLHWFFVTPTLHDT